MWKSKGNNTVSRGEDRGSFQKYVQCWTVWRFVWFCMIFIKQRNLFLHGRRTYPALRIRKMASKQPWPFLKMIIIIAMDWAMKFVQLRHRAKQKECFAKRGMNWHVSSMLSKNPEGTVEVSYFAHLFDSFSQDWYSVTSILEQLLRTTRSMNWNRMSPQHIYDPTKLAVITTASFWRLYATLENV